MKAFASAAVVGVVLVLLACSGRDLAAAQTAPMPPRMEITYAVSVGPLKIGQGRDVFELNKRSYRVVSESQTVGVAAAIYKLNVQREARGSVQANGLRPDFFEERRDGKPKRSVQFDWGRKQATLTDNGNSQTVPLPDNTWDTTSFAYNFAFAKHASEDLELHLTDGRRISPYHYRILGREKIETEIGTLDTLHVKKVQAPDDPRAFEVWLAVDYHYLPARIIATEKDGTAFESSVIKVDLGGK